MFGSGLGPIPNSHLSLVASRLEHQPGDPEIKALLWEAVDMTWEGSFMGVLGKNGIVKAGVFRAFRRCEAN